MSDSIPEQLLYQRLITLSSSSHPKASFPQGAPEQHQFSAFLLPFFPVSQSAWLTCLTDLFFARNSRLMAALLILNTSLSEWTLPLVPTQQCRSDGVKFHLQEQDLSRLPRHCRVAGSLQMAHVPGPEEASLLLPAFDGLHIVYALNSRQSKHCFLRAGGKVSLVLPESVIIDDWQLFLRQYQHRITLG